MTHEGRSAGILLALALAFSAELLGAGAVQVKAPDLQAFFTSPAGLSMSPADAKHKAEQENKWLTACRVGVPELQELQGSLTSQLGLGVSGVREHLLSLAYQHASPTDLARFYRDLRDVGFPHGDAVAHAMGLARRGAEPRLLVPLFQTLGGPGGIGLSAGEARQRAVDLTLAGADAEQLWSSFASATPALGWAAKLELAVSEAVGLHLQGLASRYAKDGKPYTAREFQKYYGQQWLSEWQAAPQQKRTADDGRDYSASAFKDYFGSSWAHRWMSAPPAELRRIALDGKTYSLQEFVGYYGGAWQQRWAESYEVADACAGLNQDSCNALARCRWRWTGDWTDSCVVRPLGS